ncbi:MAG: N-acyl-L-amino acid amidohydrolase [Rhodothermaceae bacterium]|nr:MAG: N-acyl-L-amino acid amidohydrolase [Rhodothermaceae bacterium]
MRRTHDGTEAMIPQDLETLLRTIRRHLHMHPELGTQEFETATFIREVLQMHGLRPVGPIAGTGLYVDIEGAHPGPAVGYRADIDALPIPDAKQVPYASRTPGVAHLCGHDVHTAVALGVALLLDRHREDLHGRVRVFFQPNEEGIPSGAPLMIRDGVLEGLEAVYAIHVDPTLPVGVYGLISGAATASADQFRVVVQGPGTGHSARPHQSIDTVWVATQIMSALYPLAGRITDARNAAVLTICRVHGGEAYNVIPERVWFGGTIRCTEPEDRARLKDQLLRTAAAIGHLHRAHVEVDFDDGAPAVRNDPRLIDTVRQTILEMHGPEAIFEIPRPSMGGEDFAYYLEEVPGALIRVGTASGPETSHPLHDSCFDVDEAALVPAAHLMSRVLRSHLERHPLG